VPNDSSIMWSAGALPPGAPGLIKVCVLHQVLDLREMNKTYRKLILLKHASGTLEWDGGENEGGRDGILDRSAGVAKDSLHVRLVHYVQDTSEPLFSLAAEAIGCTYESCLIPRRSTKCVNEWKSTRRLTSRPTIGARIQ
jgi:hypothetical protein